MSAPANGCLLNPQAHYFFTLWTWLAPNLGGQKNTAFPWTNRLSFYSAALLVGFTFCFRHFSHHPTGCFSQAASRSAFWAMEAEASAWLYELVNTLNTYGKEKLVGSNQCNQVLSHTSSPTARPLKARAWTTWGTFWCSRRMTGRSTSTNLRWTGRLVTCLTLGTPCSLSKVSWNLVCKVSVYSWFPCLETKPAMGQLFRLRPREPE